MNTLTHGSDNGRIRRFEVNGQGSKLTLAAIRDIVKKWPVYKKSPPHTLEARLWEDFVTSGTGVAIVDTLADETPIENTGENMPNSSGTYMKGDRLDLALQKLKDGLQAWKMGQSEPSVANFLQTVLDSVNQLTERVKLLEEKAVKNERSSDSSHKCKCLTGGCGRP